MKTLYLIKRGPRPEYHKAPFHPVIICTHKPTAKWEAGATDDAAWVWEKSGWTNDGAGWLLVRWNGFDVDYGHVVRGMKMPDGTNAAFWRDYKSESCVSPLIDIAVWWSDLPLPEWLQERGVVYPPDLFSQERVLDNVGDDKRRYLGRPAYWPSGTLTDHKPTRTHRN